MRQELERFVSAASTLAPLLVTGFAPFGAHRVNPSEQVVRALGKREGLITAVLPVSYRRAEAQLSELLEAAEPRALLLLGLAAGSEIRLERVARNLDESDACDEDGEARAGQPISASGPADYESTLPLAGFATALARLDLPVTWSRDAGGFLCNHVFYRASEWLDQRGRRIPCGFVHLPPLAELALERQIAAVGACLDVLSSVSHSSGR